MCQKNVISHETGNTHCAYGLSLRNSIKTNKKKKIKLFCIMCVSAWKEQAYQINTLLQSAQA